MPYMTRGASVTEEGVCVCVSGEGWEEGINSVTHDEGGAVCV